MSDETITVILERTGNSWVASVSERALVIGEAAGDGPAEVLELIGQALDRREVDRLTATVAPLSVAERELMGDCAAVIGYLDGDGATEDRIVRELRLPRDRIVRALEQGERDGALEHDNRNPARWRRSL